MLVPPPGPRAGGFDFDAPTRGGEDARVVPPPAGEEDVGALEGADCRVGPEGGVGKGGVEDLHIPISIRSKLGGMEKSRSDKRVLSKS